MMSPEFVTLLLEVAFWALFLLRFLRQGHPGFQNLSDMVLIPPKNFS